MTLYTFTYYNRLTGQYEMPRAVPTQKDDLVESIFVAIKSSDHKLDYLLEYDVYYTGTFDTKTGELDIQKELLVSLTKEAIYGKEE